MDRKKKIRIKNRLIIGSVYVSVIVFVLSALCIDSASWIPTIICGCCEAWMGFILYCNLRKPSQKGEKRNEIKNQEDSINELQGCEEQRNIV